MGIGEGSGGDQKRGLPVDCGVFSHPGRVGPAPRNRIQGRASRHSPTPIRRDPELPGSRCMSSESTRLPVVVPLPHGVKGYAQRFLSRATAGIATNRRYRRIRRTPYGSCVTLASSAMHVLREDEIPTHHRTALPCSWARKFPNGAVRQGKKRFQSRRDRKRNDGKGEARA